MAAEQLTTTQGLRIIAGESPEWTGGRRHLRR
jgi:hypothetical protein